ncbi:AAA family ATPase [Vibrio breoganii]
MTVEYNFNAIPREFKTHKNWLLWKYETVNERVTKVPYQANGSRADSTNPKTWTTFDDAEMAYIAGDFSGLGFAIGDSGLTCVDVDHISEWDFQSPLEPLANDCYAELSPSGDGLHLWVKAQKPNSKCKSKNFHNSMIEVYNSDRFITMTGANAAGEIVECQPQFDEAFKDLFFPPVNKPKTTTAANAPTLTMDDNEIISRISNENSKGRIEWIKWNNFGAADSEDLSASDQAYVNKVAFYTKDSAQIERIWLSSELGKREKTQKRQDYRDRTIERALNDVDSHSPQIEAAKVERQAKAVESGDDEYLREKVLEMLENIKTDEGLAGADTEVKVDFAKEALYEFGDQFTCLDLCEDVFKGLAATVWEGFAGSWKPDAYLVRIERIDITPYTDMKPNPLNGKSFKLNLRDEVKPKEFLFNDFTAPRGEVTVISGANGSGKTQLACQIAVQAATRRLIMLDENMKTSFAVSGDEPLKVAAISFEDDAHTYQVRLRNTIMNYPGSGLNVGQAFDAMDERFDMVDMGEMFGVSCLLSHYCTGTKVIEPTSTYHHLKGYIKKGGFDLVIVDPFHYSTAAEENDNNSQGQHTMLLRQLARECECSIIAFAHTTDSNPSRVRGATSIMDRARQGWMFAPLSKLYQHHQATKHLPKPSPEQLPDGVSVSDVVWLMMSKNSYGPKKEEYTLFKRDELGLLVPFNIIDAEQVATDEQRIMAYVRECPKREATQAIVIDGLDMPQSTVQRKFKAMIDRGELVESRKVGRSVYYKVEGDE